MTFIWLAALLALLSPLLVVFGLRMAPPLADDEEALKWADDEGEPIRPSDAPARIAQATVRWRGYLFAPALLLYHLAGTYLAYLVFSRLCELDLAMMPPSAFHFRWGLAWAAAVCAGMVVSLMGSAVGVGLTHRVLLGRRGQAELLQWLASQRIWTPDTGRGLVGLAWAYGVMFAVFVLMIMPHHTRVDEEAIRVRKWFGVEYVYRLDEIESLAVSTHIKEPGKETWRLRLHLRMEDGRKEPLYELGEAPEEFFVWLEARTGKTIRRVRLAEELSK